MLHVFLRFLCLSKKRAKTLKTCTTSREMCWCIYWTASQATYVCSVGKLRLDWTLFHHIFLLSHMRKINMLLKKKGECLCLWNSWVYYLKWNIRDNLALNSDEKWSKYAVIDKSCADTDALGNRSSWDYASLCVRKSVQQWNKCRYPWL